MMRRAPVRMTWLLGAVGVAIAVACKGSTAPHQPALCPSYSGGKASADSLVGVYQLASYCIDTLPVHGPPADTGHVTLKRATPADSITAVFATQGQSPLNVAGTYTLSGTDSIHVTGNVTTPLGPVGVELLGRFLLQQNTLSVSGTLAVTLTSPHFLSFIGARPGP